MEIRSLIVEEGLSHGEIQLRLNLKPATYFRYLDLLFKTEQEAIEVNSRGYAGYYSSNIPCEIGMSEATGNDYISIVYLVERASRNQVI